MKIDFSNYSLENVNKAIFFFQVLLLDETFYLDTYESVNFKYGNNFPKSHPENNKIKHFCCRIYGTLQHSFHFSKFEGADFKYVKSFFKFQFKNADVRFEFRLAILKPNFFMVTKKNIAKCWSS